MVVNTKQQKKHNCYFLSKEISPNIFLQQTFVLKFPIDYFCLIISHNIIKAEIKFRFKSG